MDRQRGSSGTEWESSAGYSRTVRVGNRIDVSSTTATGGDGDVVGVGDLHVQTKRAIANVEEALAASARCSTRRSAHGCS